MFNKIKQYLYILTGNELPSSLSNMSYKIMNGIIDTKKLIRVNNLCFTEFNRIVYNNESYEIHNNVLDLNNKRNIISIAKIQ